jgi:hypothetical protein
LPQTTKHKDTKKYITQTIFLSIRHFFDAKIVKGKKNVRNWNEDAVILLSFNRAIC